jgi:hypothetical protein
MDGTMLTDYTVACTILGAMGGVKGAAWLASVDNVITDTVCQAIPYTPPAPRQADVIDLAAYRAARK